MSVRLAGWTDEKIKANLKEAFESGCTCLTITSKRQDVGLMKCWWGVEQGYLDAPSVVELDEQSTVWEFYWSARARKEWAG